MPPKARSGLHVHAKPLAEKTKITDTRKQNFVIEKEFARGGFGRIYSAHQVDSANFGKTGSLVVKVEPQGNGPLFTEMTVFQRILKPEMLQDWMKRKKISHLGLPQYISSGILNYAGEMMRFLVMPKFAGSLENYRTEIGGTFEPRVVFNIAKQCAYSLAYLQDQDYVHADLKADNILLSAANSPEKCYLVDFGLARMVRSNVEKADKKKAHNGTAIFTSLDAHRGCSPSLRGDLEILAYNILFWISGSLPWQKLETQPDLVFAEKEKFAKNIEKSIAPLVPSGLLKFLVNIFKIAYETPYLDRIDYDNVLSVLDKALVSAKSAPSAGTQTGAPLSKNSKIVKIPSLSPASLQSRSFAVMDGTPCTSTAMSSAVKKSAPIARFSTLEANSRILALRKPQRKRKVREVSDLPSRTSKRNKEAFPEESDPKNATAGAAANKSPLRTKKPAASVAKKVAVRTEPVSISPRSNGDYFSSNS